MILATTDSSGSTCIPSSSRVSRRSALARLGAAGVTLTSAWSAQARTPAAPGKLVVVMLRGAVDGLSVVVPHGEADYARARPELAIARPGVPDGALPLDDLFGLHPALAVLAPWWQDDRLAFVHASGSTDPTRSHFDAQDHMETATPGRRATPDGWMNRLLLELGQRDSPAFGVNVGPLMPRIFAGAADVTSMAVSATDRLDPGGSPAQSAVLDRLLSADPATARAWAALRETREALRQSAEVMGPGMDAGAAPGAVPLASLAADCARLGRLMRRESSVRAAFLSVGGWDTHVGQGGATGALANRLRGLAGGLDALARSLDDGLDDTLILVMSEFGRTVRQNGTRGTDHGHGNVMWLLGGPVRRAQVAGRWPGLDAAALHDGRDLAVTTDFRQVIAQVLQRHLRLDDAALSRVLPNGPGHTAALDLLRG
jgi:uncharacterized protein (DUF1501 family)